MIFKFRLCKKSMKYFVVFNDYIMDNLNDNKPTATSKTEHPFLGEENETDTALTGFSLQSDMLTSAYINVDSGVLRQMLAAYQIKQTSTNHRATFLGGLYTKTGGSTDDTSLDINAGNYPLDGVAPLTGSTVKGIKLSGNSLPKEGITAKEWTEIKEIFRTAFNVDTLPSPVFDANTKEADIAIPNTYLSLTSAVTQWVKLKSLVIKYTSIPDAGTSTKTDIDGATADIAYEGLTYTLHIDDTYCPRQQIGNGMSNQQIFLWGNIGYGADTSAINTVKDKFQFSRHLKDTTCSVFDIDFIRDRFAIMNIIGHLGRIYQTATNMMLPLKLVSYMAQVKLDRLDRVLHYVALTNLLLHGSSHTTDSQKSLADIFNFLINDNNYLLVTNGGNKGITIRGWNDNNDRVSTSHEDRPTCLNKDQPYGYTTDVSSKEVKHVIVTNVPGMDNGRYGATMSSSNMINGFFGSISLDVSYSDTHTPVDVNGMTVHQWNYGNTSNIDGDNNPARWNVNANEDYYALVINNSANC